MPPQQPTDKLPEGDPRSVEESVVVVRPPPSSFARHSLATFGCDFVASWLAILVSLTLSHPVDTLRVRRQTHLHTARETIRRHGFHSLYHGFLTPMVTTGPVVANSMAMNDFFKRAISRANYGDPEAKHRMTTSELALAGSATGVVSSLLQCPIAVAKVQQQIAIARGSGSSGRSCGGGGGAAAEAAVVPPPRAPARLQSGFTATLRLVYQREGIRGLYRGLPLEALQAGLGRLVYFTVYQRGKETQLPPLSGQRLPFL